jgi:predicted nucleic acid-binding protein
MTRVGIDTSVLIGLLDPRDVWHGPAVMLKQALKAHQAEVTVFDCVLAEAVSTMARRIYEQRRSTDLDLLLTRIRDDYPIDGILWVLPDVPVLYHDILDLVRSSRGALNFNDALIALSCHLRDIPLVASFDRDFDDVDWLKRVAQPGDLV